MGQERNEAAERNVEGEIIDRRTSVAAGYREAARDLGEGDALGVWQFRGGWHVVDLLKY